MEASKDAPKPFVWVKSADENLWKIAKVTMAATGDAESAQGLLRQDTG